MGAGFLLRDDRNISEIDNEGYSKLPTKSLNCAL